MSDTPPPPNSLQAVLGAMLFGAGRPLSPDELRAALRARAEGAAPGSPEAIFAQASAADIRVCLDDIAATLARADLGLRLCREAGRYAYRTDPAAGPWVRALVKAAPPQRLSRAALETLAIVAYRQPIARAEIESVRGVSADHTLRALLELNLIRPVGRSALPGRPFLYGTTATFLEHFGLDGLDALRATAPEPPAEA